MTVVSEDSLPPNVRPGNCNRGHIGTEDVQPQKAEGNMSLPCFISLQEQPGLGQRKLAEETACWSVKPGGIEPWCCAEKEASLKEEI